MTDPVRRLGLTLAIVVAVFSTVVACEGAAGSADPSASVSPTPSASINTDTIIDEFLDDANKKNVVALVNTENGRFMAKARIRIDKIGSDKVDPLNQASAESRCTDCQTIAVALQVVIYKRGSNSVTPQNVATALNANCTRCVTVALAYQYVIPVDNYKEVPPRVRELTKEMERELQYFEKVRSVSEIDPKQAEARLIAVLDKYADLKEYLRALRDEKKTEASPSPSASAAPSPAPTAAPTAAPTTAAPTASPSGAP